MAKTKQQGMKWFHFLIYFVLWLNALIAGISAFTYLSLIFELIGTGHVDYLFSDPEYYVPIISGIYYVFFTIFCLITRSGLAKFKQGAPGKLYAFYVLGLVPIVLTIAQTFVLGGAEAIIAYFADPTSYSFIGSIIGTVIAISLNRTYFKKREHLFVN